MAVLMKYIYQNRRGVNSNFFSFLILFSLLFIYHFWNDVSGHTSIWFVKMSRVLHSFLSLEKNLSAYSYLWTGSSGCNFVVASLEWATQSASLLYRDISHNFWQEWIDGYIHLHTQLFSFQFRTSERKLKRSMSKCYERLFFHRTDICGIPRSFCSLLFTG